MSGALPCRYCATQLAVDTVPVQSSHGLALSKAIFKLTLTLLGSCGLALAAQASIAAEAARVLIIDSFGHGNSPYEVFSTDFRSELSRRLTSPVAYYEISLDGTHFDMARDAAPFARFLQETFGPTPPDLVVPVGPPAFRVYAAIRDRVFPGVPMLAAAVERRAMEGVALADGDASMTTDVDFKLLVQNILTLLPDTERIVVILGDSPIERYWVKVVENEIRSVGERIAVEFLNKLSLEDVEKRVAALPPRSTILFLQMLVDGAGVSRDQGFAQERIRDAANAPMFGLYAGQFGKGLVGGPLMSEHLVAMRAAESARAMLSGDAKVSVVSQTLGLGVPVYDARELQRWGIPDERLLQPHEIRFREPSIWQQYKWVIVAALAVFALQFALLSGLLLQRARRRSAESAARQLSGRILTAHEDERRRLARELHDDVTPRLARLAIEAKRTQVHALAAGDQDQDIFSMHDELVRLSEDVHAFSYRLHPTVLDDLGLVDALQAECDRWSAGHAVNVQFDDGGLEDKLPSDFAVCLYRVAQESLRNIARHAEAHTIKVSLAQRDGGLCLSVEDDGIGFDAKSAQTRPGLGLASMRARVRQLDGTLEVRSAPGAGTTIVACLPRSGPDHD